MNNVEEVKELAKELFILYMKDSPASSRNSASRNANYAIRDALIFFEEFKESSDAMYES